MKSKDLLKQKIITFGGLLLRFIIAYAIAVFIMEVFIDGILNDIIANVTYDKDVSLYYWFVTHKAGVILGAVAIIFCAILYRYISKRENDMNELYNSLEKILDENSTKIELPNSLWQYAEKLNTIKYQYELNKSKAKEAEQKKNDLMMYMAHDLKTPLTSVIGYLSLLNEANIQDKQAEQKYLKIAYDKSLRLEELTNQFFEITRYNLNDMPINKINIDLSILFDQLIDEFYPMLEERKLKLEVNKPNTLIYKADGDKLARAFGNLLKNAISYSYENTIITVDVIETEKNIEIIFKNKGVTIPEYKLDKIFEQFYRADESRGTNNGGAGLGLAITKDIIELHNGTIEAKSEDEVIEFIVKLMK